MYLAVTIDIYDEFFSRKFIQRVIAEHQLKLLIFNSELSGYQWSSSHGPDLQITTGTTTTARVTVGERAPITFILPFLRANTGIY